MVLSIQTSLYHQWQWSYWDLMRRALVKPTHVREAAPSGMWDFQASFTANEWEEDNVKGCEMLMIQKDSLTAQEPPCTFEPRRRTEQAASSTAESADTNGPQTRNESRSTTIGLERSGPRHTFRGAFPDERVVPDHPFILPGFWEVFKLLVAAVFFECRAPVFFGVICAYLIYQSGIIDFNNRDRSLEQTLRELQQDRAVEREAVSARQYGEAGAPERTSPPNETEPFPAEGVPTGESSAEEVSIASDNMREPGGLADQGPLEISAPAQLVPELGSSAVQGEPSYGFWQRFFYQLLVMFVCTLLPWWSPNPRLIGLM